MKQSAIEDLMKTIAPIIRKYFEQSIAPLNKRLEELERKGVEYMGVHQRALDYRRGSIVTYGGSMFVAVGEVKAGEVPGQSSSWQLAVKAGRDARDRRDERDA